MERMKVGILGAGGIAELMAATLQKMDCAIAYAVAARDLERAKDFASRHGIEKAYGSYQAMLDDPQVEMVYVATPISHHRDQVMLCLDHGKHVLCEKAFTANASQAREILEHAKVKKLLLTEAIWTRYMPFSQTIKDVVESGVLGKVNALTANLGYDVHHKERLRNPALAGGALLDIGVYPLNFASMLFGTEIVDCVSACCKYATGVDAQESITLTFASGRMAALFSSMLNRTDRKGIIYGDKGYLVVENINNPVSAGLYSPDWELTETYHRPEQISGYEYQVVSAVKAIREGRLECPEMPHRETIRIMHLCDNLHREWGIV